MFLLTKTIKRIFFNWNKMEITEMQTVEILSWQLSEIKFVLKY